ncbi:MAG: hypothetical protein ABIJ09_02730 [Pseudomonadota bacterium]
MDLFDGLLIDFASASILTVVSYALKKGLAKGIADGVAKGVSTWLASTIPAVLDVISVGVIYVVALIAEIIVVFLFWSFVIGFFLSLFGWDPYRPVRQLSDVSVGSSASPSSASPEATPEASSTSLSKTTQPVEEAPSYQANTESPPPPPPAPDPSNPPEVMRGRIVFFKISTREKDARADFAIAHFNAFRLTIERDGLAPTNISGTKIRPTSVQGEQEQYSYSTNAEGLRAIVLTFLGPTGAPLESRRYEYLPTGAKQ